MNSPDLTILVPAFEEEKRIGKTLNTLAKYLATDNQMRRLRIEVVVVSADARDKTHEIVLSKMPLFTDLKLLKPGPKAGKGRDVQFGMLRAKGKAILFMDADLATPLSHVFEFYTAYLNGSEVVIGTRNLLKQHSNYLRRLVSNCGNLLFRIVSGMWVEDSQCGFKLFSNAAAKLCFSKLTIMGWGFDMEVLTIARANKLKIKTIRIDDWKHMADGKFEDNVLANSLRSLMDLMKIGLKRVRRYYTTT